MKPVDEHRIHQIFELSVWLKGARALIECVGGILLYVVTTDAIASWVNALTAEELIGDPNDFIAGYLSQMASHFSVASKEFYAVVASGFAGGLGRIHGLSSLPLLIHPFPGPACPIVFDAIVMVLIWHEWKVVMQHKPA